MARQIDCNRLIIYRQTNGDGSLKSFRPADARHFRPSDSTLLCRYCEADALAERAAIELRKNAVLRNGKPNAWLAVQEKNVRALVSLSMRLRLSPQSRIDAKALGRQQPARPSAYDVMDWEFLNENGRRSS